MITYYTTGTGVLDSYFDVQQPPLEEERMLDAPPTITRTRLLAVEVTICGDTFCLAEGWALRLLFKFNVISELDFRKVPQCCPLLLLEASRTEAVFTNNSNLKNVHLLWESLSASKVKCGLGKNSPGGFVRWVNGFAFFFSPCLA